MPARRLVVSLVACAVLAVVFGALSAKEKKPSEQYAERSRKYVAAIAARYVAVAKWDFKNKLFQFAIMDHQTAIKIDPNCKAAREYLGYVRRRGEWILMPENEPRIKQNQKAQTQTQGDMDRLYKERDELIESAKEYAAVKYADLGIWCRKKGLELQALKAFEISLKNDRECAKTRKALGHVKIDDEWLTPKQAQARQEAKEGKVVQGGSNWEGALGLTLNKMNSGHFRIETVFPVDALKRYIKECETCYAYFLRDFGESPDKEVWPGRRGRLLVLDTKAQWDSFVDKFVHGDKEFTRKTKGTINRNGLTGVQYQGEKGSIDVTVDGLVHKAAHFLVSHHLHLEQPWIQEGFAYYYTVKVLNTTRTHCVAQDKYSNTRNDQKWSQSDNWKELVKEAVTNGEDFDLRMLVGLPLPSMKQPQAVKSWALITWFFDHHKESFMKWLSAAAKGMDQGEAFKEFFGKSMEDLDREWRAYVLENY